MRDLIAVLILCLATQFVVAQVNIQAGLKFGFNRIGLFYNPNIDFIIGQNQIDIGIKYYGYDKVFEKNTVGLSAAYSYLFSSDRIYCGPAVNYAFFSEKKSNSNLLLHELNVGNTIGVKFENHFSIYSIIAIGIVLNSSKNEIMTTDLNYLNYEFALGLAYRFGAHDN